MHSRELARRSAVAHSRIITAAGTLARKHKLPEAFVTAIQTVTARDARVRALYQQEAIADLLEALIDPKGASKEVASREAAPKAHEGRRKAGGAEELGDEDAPDLATLVDELSKE